MLNPTEGVLVPGGQASLAHVYMKNRCGQARELFYNVEDSSTYVTGVTAQKVTDEYIWLKVLKDTIHIYSSLSRTL